MNSKSLKKGVAKTKLPDDTHVINHETLMPTSTYSETILERLKDDIEQLSVFRHLEILKILLKCPEYVINENAHGTYVNLSELPIACLDNIAEYVKYSIQQETELVAGETKREEILKQQKNLQLTNA